jgi:hypothetical protein
MSFMRTSFIRVPEDAWRLMSLSRVLSEIRRRQSVVPIGVHGQTTERALRAPLLYDHCSGTRISAAYAPVATIFIASCGHLWP